ncbi:MAG: type VI secretion system tip protein VgrG [Ignavibacteria bacterium]|nr:type VI secretion system tip protein VgrG [Ignavibacteria bacterium]
MAEVQTIGQAIKDTDRISIELLIDGLDCSNTYQIITASINLEINKIPSAHILIVDGEPDTEDFAASSSNVFKPGKKIEIKLGYKNSTEKVFQGIIISNSLNLNSDRSESNIEAKDETVKMPINKGNRHYNDKSDSDVAEQLLLENSIKEYNLDPLTAKHEQLVQSNITDWDYMISRIDVNGMLCVIDNSQVVIKKPKLDDTAKLSLTYGTDILELHTDMDSRIQNPQIKTMVWDFANQKVQTTETDSSVIDGESKASLEELADVVNKPFEMRTPVPLTTDEQKNIVESKKVRQALSKIKGKVKYQGTRKVLPADFIIINGIGANFTGKIFVSAIHHEYADGDWTTEATLGWNEQFFTEQTNSGNSASATGQASSIQGLQSAVVTGILDKAGEFRVKVRLPVVNDSDEGIFARVATLDAGNNRGTFFRPEVDDEVIVGFLNDDARFPVILGMLHSSAKSSPLQPEEKNNKKGYTSRSGIKLIFDDEESSIRIETPGKESLSLMIHRVLL